MRRSIDVTTLVCHFTYPYCVPLFGSFLGQPTDPSVRREVPAPEAPVPRTSGPVEVRYGRGGSGGVKTTLLTLGGRYPSISVFSCSNYLTLFPYLETSFFRPSTLLYVPSHPPVPSCPTRLWKPSRRSNRLLWKSVVRFRNPTPTTPTRTSGSPPCLTRVLLPSRPVLDLGSRRSHPRDRAVRGRSVDVTLTYDSCVCAPPCHVIPVEFWVRGRPHSWAPWEKVFDKPKTKEPTT